MAIIAIREPEAPLRGWVSRIDPWRWAKVALTICAVLGLLSRLPRAGVDNTYPLDLDAELRVAASWSGLLNVVAALLAFEHGRAARSKASLAMGAFLFFMGLDEVASIHERLERATGVDWQILYLPVVACGGVAFVAVLRRLWVAGRRGSGALLLGGAVLWFVAQVLEKLQWNGDEERPGYDWMSTTEELFEMVGSLLFGLAMLVALQVLLRRGRNPSKAATDLP